MNLLVVQLLLIATSVACLRVCSTAKPSKSRVLGIRAMVQAPGDGTFPAGAPTDIDIDKGSNDVFSNGGQCGESLIHPSNTADMQSKSSPLFASTSSFWNGEIVGQSLSLATLLMQNTGMIILMRLSHTKAAGPGGIMYDISSAVALNEFMKLVVSSFIYVTKENGGVRDIISKSKPVHMAKIMIPSALYVLQNNLQYVAVGNLPASVYQVLIQMKIITTALMSEVLLDRKHNKQQWGSLIALFAGLALVQLSLTSGSAAAAAAAATGTLSLGIAAVVVSCLTSAGAGVYYEKTVKGTPDIGLWAFNVRILLYYVPPSFSCLCETMSLSLSLDLFLPACIL